MGTVLASGEGAVLSHRAAAALWGLGHFLRMEVTAPRHRDRPGIDVHTSILPPDEVTAEQGIPVTTFPVRCSTSPRSCLLIGSSGP
jgi:hypothetical protein